MRSIIATLRRRRWLRRLLYVVVVAVILGLLPPVRARMKAVAVLADALGVPVPRPFAASVDRTTIDLGGVTGHLYESSSDAPPILLVPGVVPEGKDDTRVVRVANAVAEAERTVFVPDLELVDKRFSKDDIERIVTATQALARRSGRDVVLLGFSYGGSFALLAAADPRLDDDIEQIALFGAYYDLVGVIQAITTGVSVVDGREIAWDAHPRAREVLERVAVRLLPNEVRPLAEEALEQGELPANAPADAEALYELLTNDDPERTFALAAQLPASVRSQIEDFSPSRVAEDIGAPVIAMHSKDDPVVPYGEAIRLEAGMEDVSLLTVSVFRHVDFDASSPGQWLGAAGDLFSTWRFTSWILSAQE